MYRARQLYKNISVISISGEKGFVVYKYIIEINIMDLVVQLFLFHFYCC